MLLSRTSCSLLAIALQLFPAAAMPAVTAADDPVPTSIDFDSLPTMTADNSLPTPVADDVFVAIPVHNPDAAWLAIMDTIPVSAVSSGDSGVPLPVNHTSDTSDEDDDDEEDANSGALEKRQRRRGRRATQIRNAQGFNTLGKRGVAYNNPAYTKYFGNALKSLAVFSYNWYSSPCGYSTQWTCTQNTKLQYIPMLWSNATALTSVWAANVAQAQARGIKSLFSFNEPDLCIGGSACMSVASAVTAYQTYMDPYADSFQLGAPAVTNGNAPYGLTWLNKFLNQCDDCVIDFVNAHWYAPISAGSSYFIQYMQQFRQQTGSQYPIFVSEFGLTSDVAYTEAQAVQFLEEVMTWMDQTDYIAGYANFYAAEGYLVNSTGTGKSWLGKKYNHYSGGPIVNGGFVA